MYLDKYRLSSPTKIGVVGTGFISKGFCHFIETQKDFHLTKILTRRNIDTVEGFKYKAKLTNSLQDLLNQSEIVIELSGGLKYTSDNVAEAHKRELPVVTLNTDFQVTYGSRHVSTGFLTEAQGDQPGCMAALNEEVISMGFEPMVYANIKGYLNHNPTTEDMLNWSAIQGISLDQVTAATDGTKLQSEMAFIANGLGATIAQKGLIGYTTNNLHEGAMYLAQEAENLGKPIADYLLSDPNAIAKLPKGIFIVAKHERYHQPMLEYYKIGKWPYYIFHKPYYLPHLEIVKTLRSLVNRNIVPFNNGDVAHVIVTALTKKALSKGEIIEKGIGSFQLRGEAVVKSEKKNSLEIGLVENLTINRKLRYGESIRSDYCRQH
ncbi:MAG: hypothetical protein V3V00_03795 [Saprospiraceae bacterium]